MSETEGGTAVRISRDLRKDLHMKTDKELESVLGICAVQFHLVLLMKKYMTSCIVALSDIQILSWVRACTCDFLGKLLAIIHRRHDSKERGRCLCALVFTRV